nr:MMPL family transporter [Rubrobacter sp.]
EIVQQEADQKIAEENKSIQQQAQQKINEENKSIEKQANQQAAKQQQTSSAKQQEAKYEQQQKFLKSKSSDPRLTNLRTKMQKTKGVDSVTYALVNESGDAAVYTATATTAPSSRATEDLVHTLRDDVIPKATKGKQMEADVGGSTASYIDLAAEISSKLPLVIAIVLALSFLILLIAFRSLLVPLKAVIMNTVSILAAFGVVTYFFNHDWSARLIGLDGTVPIVSFVPLMMFAVLFGLSMDYEVFLMTHVREHWKETGDPHEAVVHGLASTARVITSAALIMVSVFLAFVVNGDPTIKQFGLGMAVAVGVDATVVRCFLVPAIMSLLGYAGWWMPEWMEKVTPAFSIEGNEFFAELEAKEKAEEEAKEAAEEEEPEQPATDEAEESEQAAEKESEEPKQPPVVG